MGNIVLTYLLLVGTFDVVEHIYTPYCLTKDSQMIGKETETWIG